MRYYSDMTKSLYENENELINAEQEFDLNETERDIIRSHMWPLTLFHMPKSKEAALVCLADKICTLQEFFHLS